MSILPYPTQSYPTVLYPMGSYGCIRRIPIVLFILTIPNLIVSNLYVDFSIFSVSAACLSVYLFTGHSVFHVCGSCLSIFSANPVHILYVMYSSASHRSFLPILSSIFILSVLSFLPILSISRPSCVSCLRMLSAYPIISFLYIPVYLSNCLTAYHICQSIYLFI